MIMAVVKLGFIENAFSIPAFTGYFKAANLIIFIEQTAKVLEIKLKGESIFIKTYYLFYHFSKTNINSLILGMVVFVILGVSRYLKMYIKRFKDNLFLALMPLIVTVLFTLLIFLSN